MNIYEYEWSAIDEACCGTRTIDDLVDQLRSAADRLAKMRDLGVTVWDSTARDMGNYILRLETDDPDLADGLLMDCVDVEHEKLVWNRLARKNAESAVSSMIRISKILGPSVTNAPAPLNANESGRAPNSVHNTSSV